MLEDKEEEAVEDDMSLLSMIEYVFLNHFLYNEWFLIFSQFSAVLFYLYKNEKSLLEIKLAKKQNSISIYFYIVIEDEEKNEINQLF